MTTNSTLAIVVTEGMGAHVPAGEGPLADHRAGRSSTSLELGKGRSVVALIGLSASPASSGIGFSVSLPDTGLSLGHGEMA
jgi:hypothetical protein